MKKIFLIVLLLVLSFFVIKTISAQVLSKPAGPGLGWHNDWWNPETKKIQDTPYNP